MDLASDHLYSAIPADEATGAAVVDLQGYRGALQLPFWLFESRGRRIRSDRAVTVKVTEGVDGWHVAECERLHVYAAAESYEDCLADLQDQVVHFFDTYRNLSKDDVVGLASDLADLYRDHFNDISN